MIFSTNQDTFFNINTDKYLKQEKGGLIWIELKVGLKAGKRFIYNLKLFYHVDNVGDSRLLVIHLFSMAHWQLKEEEMLNVSDIKLSISIEHEDDIIEDIKQSLEKIN